MTSSTKKKLTKTEVLELAVLEERKRCAQVARDFILQNVRYQTMEMATNISMTIQFKGNEQ